MGVVALALSAAAAGGVELLLRTANEEGPGGPMLRSVASGHGAVGAHNRVALVLVDGMRLDEARTLEAVRALSPKAEGEVVLPTPTLSRPFYHLLFTGVPPHTSGVRTNRFADRARHESVLDRVREAGGHVIILAEDLDWMRRMHGRSGDGGSDDATSIALEGVDEAVRRLREARAPSLLVVHVTSTDHTAHAEGISSAAHRAALARADAIVARLAREELTLVVLSDHGHLSSGGHGGPEREVARAPLVVRDRALQGMPDAPATTVEATQLAATLSAWLGVPAPTHAVGPPAAAFLPPERRDDGTASYDRLASVAHRGEQLARASLSSRQRWTVAVALLLSLMSLGTIKRAYGFDRSVALAIVAWPTSLVGLHLALGRPLSLSAIDTQLGHSLRVAALGALAALLAFLLARLLARGDERTRRAAASVGWSAASSALLAIAWVGFALGPWPLTPLETYAPLLALGAASAALFVLGVVLLASGLFDGRRSPHTHANP